MKEKVFQVCEMSKKTYRVNWKPLLFPPAQWTKTFQFLPYFSFDYTTVRAIYYNLEPLQKRKQEFMKALAYWSFPSKRVIRRYKSLRLDILVCVLLLRNLPVNAGRILFIYGINSCMSIHLWFKELHSGWVTGMDGVAAAHFALLSNRITKKRL